MAYIKALVLLGVVATVMGAPKEETAVPAEVVPAAKSPSEKAPASPDQPRAKKDVLLASPYFTTYEDAVHLPTYTRAAYVAAAPVSAVAPSVAVPALTAYHAYHPYAYSALPAYRSVYGTVVV